MVGGLNSPRQLVSQLRSFILSGMRQQEITIETSPVSYKNGKPTGMFPLAMPFTIRYAVSLLLLPLH
jgi:hypothetical protein